MNENTKYFLYYLLAMLGALALGIGVWWVLLKMAASIIIPALKQ